MFVFAGSSGCLRSSGLRTLEGDADIGALGVDGASVAVETSDEVPETNETNDEDRRLALGGGSSTACAGDSATFDITRIGPFHDHYVARLAIGVCCRVRTRIPSFRGAGWMQVQDACSLRRSRRHVGRTAQGPDPRAISLVRGRIMVLAVSSSSTTGPRAREAHHHHRPEVLDACQPGRPPVRGAGRSSWPAASVASRLHGLLALVRAHAALPATAPARVRGHATRAW